MRRKDDEPSAIRTRMQAYREQTEPVVAWYRGDGTHFIRIDAVGAVDDVTRRVVEALDECRTDEERR